jgi:hypothetical protein
MIKPGARLHCPPCSTDQSRQSHAKPANSNSCPYCQTAQDLRVYIHGCKPMQPVSVSLGPGMQRGSISLAFGDEVAALQADTSMFIGSRDDNSSVRIGVDPPV